MAGRSQSRWQRILQEVAVGFQDGSEDKMAALALAVAFRPDAPPVRFNDVLAYRQAQARPLIAGARSVGLVEALEDAVAQVIRDAGPVVED